MPIFEYRCAACGETFEALVLRRSDEEEVACARCGASEVERLLSAPALASGGGCAPAGGGFT